MVTVDSLRFRAWMCFDTTGMSFTSPPILEHLILIKFPFDQIVRPPGGRGASGRDQVQPNATLDPEVIWNVA